MLKLVNELSTRVVVVTVRGSSYTKFEAVHVRYTTLNDCELNTSSGMGMFHIPDRLNRIACGVPRKV